MDDSDTTVEQNLAQLHSPREQVTRLKQALEESRQAEERLRQSEERYRELADSLPETVFEMDTDGRLTYSNRAAFRHFRCGPEELERGIHVVEWMAAEDRERAGSNVRAVLCGTPTPGEEYTAIRRDGTTFPCTILSDRIVRDGKVVGLRGFVVDITERRRLQDQLLRAQRLEATGRIAAQVAHDFNNLLGPIIAYPDLTRMRLPADHPACQYCDAMQSAAERMADINEDLMALGRRGLLDERPMDLNDLVEQAVQQIDGKETPKIVLHLDPELMAVSGSPAQLSRVMANLLSNARDSIQETGRITVITENLHVDDTRIDPCPTATRERVRLRVIDTGCGIPPEKLGRIFDPFFTAKTKAGHRGSGLGLSIVQSIVEDHKGCIDVDSEVGRGTTFSVYFPDCQEPMVVCASGDLPGGTERLMVVDDDQLQREVTRESLSRLGYRVVAAASGEEAVQRLAEHPVELVILDMVMPGEEVRGHGWRVQGKGPEADREAPGHGAARCRGRGQPEARRVDSRERTSGVQCLAPRSVRVAVLPVHGDH